MGLPTTMGLAIALAAAGLTCSPTGDRHAGSAVSEADAKAQNERPAESPELEMLPTPFTAEQLRDEWVPGLRVELHRWTPSDEAFERWRVVAADADSVEIETVRIDKEGAPVGEPETRRSRWTELRDHASYPASVASRQRQTRSTKLGELEGWLYTLQDPKAGSTSELFFADSLPGAPVEMTVRSGDEIVFRLEQTEHERPAANPGK
jgi:hypothetical protein